MHMVRAGVRLRVDDLRGVPFALAVAGVEHVADLIGTRQLADGRAGHDGAQEEIFLEAGGKREAGQLILLEFHLVVEEAVDLSHAEPAIVVAVDERVAGKGANEPLGEGPIPGRGIGSRDRSQRRHTDLGALLLELPQHAAQRARAAAIADQEKPVPLPLVENREDLIHVENGVVGARGS